MATPLDIGILKQLGIIFPLLFVFIVVYAILIKTDYFKDNKGLASLLGIVLAIMVLFSPIVRETVNRIAPWFVLLFIFIIFTLIAIMIFGTTESDIMDVVKGGKYTFIIYWVVALVLIITVGSLTSVLSEQGGIGNTADSYSEDAGDIAVGDGEGQTSEFWKTLVHPKVLGLILVLMIASFTVRYMTRM